MVRIGTLNIASGRDGTGRSVDAAALAASVADLDVDVLSVQEVDTGQQRSDGVDQPAVLAAAIGAVDWRSAPTLHGTPDPFRSWRALEPALRGPDDEPVGPRYGVALLSRLPVRRWEVLGLTAGTVKLPLRAPDPRTGRTRTWWFPDEPRAAVAAELEDGLTVVATHLSFAAHAAARQLTVVRRWVRALTDGPVVVAGDLNLGGSLPALVTGGRRLVDAQTWPAPHPRVQFDHVLALDHLHGSDVVVRALPIGDHRAVLVTVTQG